MAWRALRSATVPALLSAGSHALLLGSAAGWPCATGFELGSNAPEARDANDPDETNLLRVAWDPTDMPGRSHGECDCWANSACCAPNHSVVLSATQAIAPALSWARPMTAISHCYGQDRFFPGGFDTLWRAQPHGPSRVGLSGTGADQPITDALAWHQPIIRVEQVEARSPQDAVELRAALEAAQGAFAACYRRALIDHDWLRGHVVFRAKVWPDGTASTTIQYPDTTVRDPALLCCLQNVLPLSGSFGRAGATATDRFALRLVPPPASR